MTAPMMAREASEPERVAKQAARETVMRMTDAGWEIKPHRGVFATSDEVDLVDQIIGWIEEHMRPAP